MHRDPKEEVVSAPKSREQHISKNIEENVKYQEKFKQKYYIYYYRVAFFPISFHLYLGCTTSV